jgi:hypothetical protein
MQDEHVRNREFDSEAMERAIAEAAREVRAKHKARRK